MDRQENLEYRKGCPYDAMGDFSGLMDDSPPEDVKKEQPVQPEK